MMNAPVTNNAAAATTNKRVYSSQDALMQAMRDFLDSAVVAPVPSAPVLPIPSFRIRCKEGPGGKSTFKTYNFNPELVNKLRQSYLSGVPTQTILRTYCKEDRNLTVGRMYRLLAGLRTRRPLPETVEGYRKEMRALYASGKTIAQISSRFYSIDPRVTYCVVAELVNGMEEANYSARAKTETPALRQTMGIPAPSKKSNNAPIVKNAAMPPNVSQAATKKELGRVFSDASEQTSAKDEGHINVNFLVRKSEHDKILAAMRAIGINNRSKFMRHLLGLSY